MSGDVGREPEAPGEEAGRAPTAVKICGLTRLDDARAAAAAGADYLGAILSPGFSRSVPVERAARFRSVAEGTPGHAVPTLVAVLVDATLADATAAARASGAGVLQLHGGEPPSFLRGLRREGPWTLWKALQVRAADDVARALEDYGDVADGLLLDGWHEGRGGGVGARFPWEVVETVRAAFPAGLAFIAAGGLSPSNVAEAVRRLAPDVVDVSSGVEGRVGEKDGAKVRDFIRSARNARAGRGS